MGPTRCPRRRQARPVGAGKPAPDGFTLIELATVLLVISIAVGVAVPAFRRLGTQDDLTEATRRVETLFRLARDSAITSGVAVTVVIDSVTGLVWVDSPNRHRLASRAMSAAPTSFFDEVDPELAAALLAMPAEALVPGSPLGLPETVEMQLPRARALFRFEPSGAALADTLVLVGPFGVRAVTLDPWTGDVTVRSP